MQTIKLFLAREGGSVERMEKDFPLYQGQYNNVLLNVYVPKEWLSPSFSIYASNYANIVTPFVAGTAVKLAMRTIERDGTFSQSKSHYMRFVKMVDYNGFSYALFERKLPKDFTFYNGMGFAAPTLIINVVNVQYGSITSVSAETSVTGGVVSVDQTTFSQHVPAVSQNYVYTYYTISGTITANGWYDRNGDKITLSDLGITFTGTPENENIITISVTAANPTILDVATSQSIKLDILPSAYLDTTGVESPEEATELEALGSRVATLEAEIAEKQDQVDNRLQTTQKDVALAINELKDKDTSQDNAINTNTNNITSQGNRITALEQQRAAGENYIGTYTFTTSTPTLPSDAQMLAFVRSVKGATYDLQGGELVLVIQDITTAQNHTYKYVYNPNTTSWVYYQIDNIEKASNGIDGIVRGTYGIGSTNDTLVAITNGVITDIYIKKSGSYINIKAQILANDSNITNIINGTIVVDKAYKDENGNNIKNTYQTKSEGATKAYVKEYALPKQFNNVFYLTNSGISETAPSSLEILASKTIGLGETVLFTSYYTVGDFKFQLFARNSMKSYIYTMETGTDTFTYKATIYKEDGTTSALTLLGTGTANPVTASASFRSIGIFISFASLQRAIEFQQGDKLKVVYSIVRTASGTATTQVMTALNYFSTLYINMNAECIVTAQVVQGTGNSQIDVMSQDAVTKFGKIASEQITDQALTYDVATGLTISENREQTRENGDTDTYSTDVVVPMAFEGDMSADVNAGGDLLVVKGAEKVTITLITPSQTTGTLSDADYAKLVSKDSNYIELDDNDGHIEKYYLNTNASGDGYRQYIHVQDEAGTASIKSFTITISTKSWVVVESSLDLSIPEITISSATQIIENKSYSVSLSSVDIAKLDTIKNNIIKINFTGAVATLLGATYAWIKRDGTLNTSPSTYMFSCASNEISSTDAHIKKLGSFNISHVVGSNIAYVSLGRVNLDTVATIEDNAISSAKTWSSNKINNSISQAVATIKDISASEIFTEFASGYNDYSISLFVSYYSQPSPSGYTQRQRACCYGNGYYVICGASGSMAYSSSGVLWNSITPFASGTLTGICYGKGYFLCCEYETNKIWKATSPNDTWTNIYTGSNAFESIQYINNTFVATGANGLILFSNDGKNWKQKTTGVSATILRCAYGNGLYVAVGSGGTIITSINGNEWTARTSGTTNDIRTITYGNRSFYCGGKELIFSTNGTTWTIVTTLPETITGWVRDFVYGEKRFYCAIYTSSGTGQIWTNMGGTWQKVLDLTSTNTRFWTICYGDEKFIASGDNGQIYMLNMYVTWFKEKPNVPYVYQRYGIVLNNGSKIVTDGNFLQKSGTKMYSHAIQFNITISGTTYTLKGNIVLSRSYAFTPLSTIPEITYTVYTSDVLPYKALVTCVNAYANGMLVTTSGNTTILSLSISSFTDTVTEL